jgi:2-polyprenyl-3-methyl-5-hydroxy-6-metoxy-1,4-benzoquinol methylase
VEQTAAPAAGPLTPDSLDHFASTYYLNETVEDIDIEELAQRHSIPRVVDAVAGCGRVLEMGYGTGLVTGELLRHGVGVEVLEGSPVLREHAMSRHPGLVVHLSMFEDFAPAAPFDAVLALHVLEHVDDAPALARVIGSWLRPGGVLVAVTPNARSLHRQLAVKMGLHEHLDDLSPRDHLVGHRRVYDLTGLRADVEAGGFDVTDEFGYFVKPLANYQMLDWSPEILDGLNRLSDAVPADLLANIGVRAVKS